MKRLVLWVVLNTLVFALFSQSVGINGTGANPDSSALLDVQATDKGMLLPRMTTAQRDGIANPATGLIIYNVDEQHLNRFDGSKWISFITTQIAPNGIFGGLDTSTELDANSSLGPDGAGQNNIQWQSFTVLKSGFLTQIELALTTTTQFPFTRSFGYNIYSGEGVNPANLLYSSSKYFDNSVNTNDWDIVFAGAGFPVTPGQKYTIEIDLKGDTPYLDWIRSQITYPYPGGVSSMGPNRDFKFRTFVTPRSPQNLIEINPSDGSTSISDGHIHIQSNGHIGMGTTTPQSRLDVSGGLTVGTGYAGTNAAPANGAILEGKLGIGTPSPQSRLDVSGGLTVGTGYAGTNAAPANGAILEGQLGIGTPSPQSKLDVSGGLTVGTGYAGTNAAPANGAILEGKVGIGTSSPDTSLHVVGQIKYEDSNQTSGHVLTSDANGVASWQAPVGDNLGNHTTTQNLQLGNYFLSGDGQNEGIFVDTAGRVGMGTTTPQHLLDFGPGVGRRLALAQNSAGTDFYGFAISPNTLEIHASSTPSEDPQIVLKLDGKVGMGTTSPQSRLDVEGGLAVGSTYAGTSAAPADGAIIEGNVGIGTNNPTQAKVVISGSTLSLIGNPHGWLNSSGAIAFPGVRNLPLSLWASNGIAALEFIAFSDARIKDIHGISDSEADLATLMQLEITDYRMKDTLAKGTAITKKVIAQQVAEVYPQAVTTDLTEVIPDIYQWAEVQDSWIMLATDLKVGERVKLITEQSAEVYEVLQAGPTRFQVAQLSTQNSELSTLFVYGREVDDFHTVDYEAISMLNVSATQEQQRIIEELKREIELLKSQHAQQLEILNALLPTLETLLSESR